MTKAEFLSILRQRTKNLSLQAAEELISFYSEMIDDRIEDGFGEEEAVAAVGCPEEIELNALMEMPQGENRQLAAQSLPAKVETKGFESRRIVFDAEILSVYAETVSSSVFFHLTDEKRVSVIFSENAKQRHEAYVKDGCLRIKQEKKKLFSLAREGGEIDIYLPKRAYDDFKVETVSGAVDLGEGFYVSNIDVNGVNGRLSAVKLMAEDVSLQAVSGTVSITDVSAERKILAEAVSGSVEAENIITDRLSLGSVSGSVRLGGCECGFLKASSTSGKVLIRVAMVKWDMKLNSVSGHIELTGSDAGEVKAESVSGAIDLNFLSPKTVRASSMSGRITAPTEQSGGLCTVETLSGRINVSF